jgi:hypothetical protein
VEGGRRICFETRHTLSNQVSGICQGDGVKGIVEKSLITDCLGDSVFQCRPGQIVI